jgi:pimeloyl-ACP methyl ester carboxylesterase
LLTTPVPVPQAAVRQAIGNAYRVLAFSTPGKADATIVRSFASHYSSRRDAARLLDTGRRLLPEIRDPFRFDRVRCAVMVIWGERDRMVASSGAERIRRGIPCARVELIPGCGHCPQVEEPDLIADLLAGFASVYVPRLAS